MSVIWDQIFIVFSSLIFAVAEIKNQIGSLSVQIAESILKQKLDTTDAHNQLVENILKQPNQN